VSEEILINASPSESRVALVDGGMLQEVWLERAGSIGYIGNIFKGQVSRVLPGLQAAFVDIGLERTAFLHAADMARHDVPLVTASPQSHRLQPCCGLARRSSCRSSRIRWAPREPA
jgi:Rne/Rng family ribonuclease